jgi:cation diffusion facilitator family transporter
VAESRIAIYGAITANVAIAITKFTVAGITGSSAMLSEGIHSGVDTFNGVLLLVGLRLSRRPATEEHPFGHGKELYFWSLIVAVLIFGLGGGISFYEGVQHVGEPVPLKDAGWNYVVLALAFVFEGTSFLVALRLFLKAAGKTPFWEALHRSKDPTTYTVLAEDSAALIGLLIAAVGIALSHWLDMPVLDGVASMLIGVLLAGVAVLLIAESRGLLIGEGIRPETARAIRKLALAHPGVSAVGRILSMYIGPDDVLVTMDLDFAPGVSAADAAAAVAALRGQVRQAYPMIKRLFIEAAGVDRVDWRSGPADPDRRGGTPGASRRFEPGRCDRLRRCRCAPSARPHRSRSAR